MAKRLAIWAVLGALLGGCQKSAELTSMTDGLAFSQFGYTIFANPLVLSLKEIHLDNGMLAGSDVIVEGAVAEMSDHGTYLVLTDDAARLLVVLTDVEPGLSMTQMRAVKSLRVLGAIESGKKGLPVLRAHSLRFATEPVPSGGKA